MRNKIFAVFIGLVLFSFLFIALISRGQSTNSSNDFLQLTLQVNSEKANYVQGEVVNLQLKVINETSENISFHQCTINPRFGYLKILIARQGEDFQEYKGPAQGVKDALCGRSQFEPNKSVNSQMTILWNSKPSTSHLNAEAARRLSAGKITTDYAFAEPGMYLIKAVLSFPDKSELKIESKPIQIVMNEPNGEDLTVWNEIKNISEVGYFLQQGGFKTDNPNKVKTLLAVIEEVAEKYPNSIIASQVEQSLEKFRADEEERRKFLEKMKKPQKN